MKKQETVRQRSFVWFFCFLGLLLTPARVRADVNFQSPIQFFTNAANRLLRALPPAYENPSISNIPIYPTNHYTPGIHRLLQLAANLYDATTNRVDLKNESPFMPHVFSPIFRRSGMSVWISGYVEETGTSILPKPIIDLTDPFQLQQIVTTGDTNHVIHGIPLIIGAKKGLPNFNEFALENALEVTRRLEFRRNNTNSPVNATNQMYVFNIASIMGIEAWNSYSNTYPRALQLIVGGVIGLGVTNELGNIEFTNDTLPSSIMSASVNIPANTWLGFTNKDAARASFRLPLSNSVSFLRSNIVYLQSATGFESVTNVNPQHVPDGVYGLYPPFKRFVNLRTRLRFVLVDTELNRIVDYVSLVAQEQSVDLASQLADNQPYSLTVPDISVAGGWRTNAVDGTGNEAKPSVGLQNQIAVSIMPIPPDSVWKSWSYDRAAGQDKTKATAFFRYNLYYPLLPNTGGFYTSNVFYAPFTPSRTVYQHVQWQANDPLVHYTASDLTDLAATNVDTNPRLFVKNGTNNSNLGQINTRYKPWGGNPFLDSTIGDPNARNLAIKDPLMTRSDDWEFPTSKLPNVGWIGRVHRGTPWQTVYLKSSDIAVNANSSGEWKNRDADSLKEWQKSTGNGNDVDAYSARPVADRHIFDHITTAPNDNASRGTLSVNQSGLAAWSAVLSGVVALTNDMADAVLSGLNPGVKAPLSPAVIEPAGAAYSGNVPVRRIVDAINATRANTNFNGSFKHMGDILAVPELTVGFFGAETNYAGTWPGGYWTNASPFLNLGNPGDRSSDNNNLTVQQFRGLTDAAYERIPQQIMSLLHGPETRFVVYAYGQSLKPADRSVIQAPGFSGMVTNYQITGEVASRSVIRIDGGATNAHRQALILL